MPKKQQSEAEIALPRQLLSDVKEFDRLLRKRPEVEERIKRILDTGLKLEPRSRHSFTRGEISKQFGAQSSRVIRFILYVNKYEVLEALKKKTAVSDGTMKFLDEILRKYGYEFERLESRYAFRNNWLSVRSTPKYSIADNRLEIQFEIRTESNETLLIEGPMPDMLRLVCAMTESLREDLEATMKTIRDFSIPTRELERINDLQEDLDKIKSLCKKATKSK